MRLRHNETREMLRAVWTEPQSLDPARRAARVTREIADRLAVLAKSLEAAGHAPQTVAMFLMRCLFTMFAEDVGLLPRRSFSELLESLRGDTEQVSPDGAGAVARDERAAASRRSCAKSCCDSTAGYSRTPRHCRSRRRSSLC